MYTTHGHKITQWNHDLLNPAALNEYADAISNKGAALENCFGFIDGTVRPISRPDENQRIVYNGHKLVHALKFQSIVLPNGLIGHLYGPVGRYILKHPIQVVRHNFIILELFSFFSQREGCTMHVRMLAVSGLYEDLENFAFCPADREMCLYGDPAYPLRIHLQAPFRVGVLTRQMEIFLFQISRS